MINKLHNKSLINDVHNILEDYEAINSLCLTRDYSWTAFMIDLKGIFGNKASLVSQIALMNIAII